MIQKALNTFSTFFTLSTMLNDLYKRSQHLVQRSVERMLSQMLKPFKRAFTFLRALAVPREAPLAKKFLSEMGARCEGNGVFFVVVFCFFFSFGFVLLFFKKELHIYLSCSF